MTSTPGAGSTFTMQLRMRGVTVTNVDVKQIEHRPHMMAIRQKIMLTEAQQTPSRGPSPPQLEPVPDAPASSSSSSTAVSLDHIPTRRILVIHAGNLVASVLRDFMEDWPGVQCHIATSLSAQWKLWQSKPSLLGEFTAIFIDHGSVKAAGEMDLLAHVHRLSRSMSVQLVAMLPLGASRTSVQHLVDSIVTHPLKPMQAYLAAHAHRIPTGVPVDSPVVGAGSPMFTVPTFHDEDAAAVPTSSIIADDSSTSSSVRANAAAVKQPEPIKRSLGSPPQLNITLQSRPMPYVSPAQGGVLSPPATTPSLYSFSGPSTGRSASTPSSLAECATLHPLRICIVDDNNINLRILGKMLSRLGYSAADVVTSADGQDAADKVFKHNLLVNGAVTNPIDLVLMDVSLLAKTLCNVDLPMLARD